jgi:2-polyprenyl-6-methoxyphenol hydroxylase-like FAD-dependent oxidoreductase
VTLLTIDEKDNERVLEERQRQQGGRVERGVELTGYRIAGDHVVASLTGPGGTSEARAHFLVGADGAHSTVREGAGIGFAGAAYPERFLLADLDIDWELSHDEGHVWIGDDGLAAVIPLPGERRFRVIVPLPPEEGDVEGLSEAELAARAEDVLRRRAGVTLRRIGEPLWASAFRIHRRQAERYREGPVFLVGDAAHIHSPVGGQGMNTGIQDAFNLGWKLALAVEDRAAPGLLDTYQAERHPVAAAVLRVTDAATRVALANNPIMRAAREYGIPPLTKLPPLRRQFLRALSQLSIGYRDSFLSVDADERVDGGPLRRKAGGLRAGDRVSDAPLRRSPAGEPVSLFALFSQGWTLLLFPGKAATPESIAELDTIAQQVTKTVGDAVQPYVVLAAPPTAPSVTAALLDASGDVIRRFGGDRGLVALVRPDGYLGFRGRPDQRGELASYLARVFAMRMGDR